MTETSSYTRFKNSGVPFVEVRHGNLAFFAARLPSGSVRAGVAAGQLETSLVLTPEEWLRVTDELGGAKPSTRAIDAALWSAPSATQLNASALRLMRCNETLQQTYLTKPVAAWLGRMCSALYPGSAPEHQQWIDAYLARFKSPEHTLGHCRAAVTEMSAAFPELRIVKGTVLCLLWGERGHWWLETAEGEIVDPTRAQFPGPLHYEEWEPGRTVRTGKCMECGAEIWEPVESLDDVAPRCFCVDNDGACENAFAGSLNGLR